MPNQVEFSEHFTGLFITLSKEEQDLIEEFVFHFETHGLHTFIGKKGPTDNVPHSDPSRQAKITFAKRHKLWHVHIGYPRWSSCRNPAGGYETSNYVVHFQKFNDSNIALIDYNSHNPMIMPSKSSLFRR